MYQHNRKIILYQVFVRLFGNKCQNNQPFGSLLQNGCGKFNDISDLALKAIRDLGATHIWYTGAIAHAKTTDYRTYGIPRSHAVIVKGRAGSPYAIRDYYDVDPDLAEDIDQRMHEFESLIHRTHQAGLKAILDFVPNHVSREYCGQNRPKSVKDLGEDDNPALAFSPNNNFYYLPGQLFIVPDDAVPNEMHQLPGELWEPYTEYPARVTGNDCFMASPSKEDWYETIKINYGIDYQDGGKINFNPAPSTWQKMREILLYWAGKGVDGFRCDMVGMVPVEFWSWVIPVLKNSYPSLIFIAEIYEPLLYRRYLDEGQFDYLYDKVGLYEILRGIAEGRLPASDISLSWQNLDGLDDRMLRFLENHDEQRIGSKYFAGNAHKAKPAMVAATTMNNGPIMIYFGQEVGEPAAGIAGYSSDEGRTTIFDYFDVPEHQRWMNQGAFDGGLLSQSQRDLRKFYAKLFRLCHECEPIYKGAFYDLMWVNRESLNQRYHYAYLRYTENECLLIVLNFSNKSYYDLPVHIPQHVFDLMQQLPETSLVISRNSQLHAEELFDNQNKVSFTMNQAIEKGVPVSLKPYDCVFYSF